MRTSLEVIMDVEAELALHGYAEPSASLFRGCQVCLLTLPQSKPVSMPPNTGNLFQSTLDATQAAAATREALQDCQGKRTALQVSIIYTQLPPYKMCQPLTVVPA